MAPLEDEWGLRLRLEYEYTVDGITYSNDRFRFGADRCRTGSAEEAPRDNFGRFPPGADITVYYDPADPTESVLVRGAAGLLRARIPWFIDWFIGGVAFWLIVIPVIAGWRAIYNYLRELVRRRPAG